jgi:hypothetical protein
MSGRISYIYIHIYIKHDSMILDRPHWYQYCSDVCKIGTYNLVVVAAETG